MTVLNRLLQENFHHWDELVVYYENSNKALKVPPVEKIALHHFNVQVEDLLTQALYDFGRARRNRDAIQRLIKTVLEDYYQGQNEQARKARGIQMAREYPTPEHYPYDHVNLFDLEDRFLGYYYALEATVKSLQAKSDAKITNNSLLNVEQNITSY